jgi:CubicO group peptidase (beta-lactamase class C family)
MDRNRIWPIPGWEESKLPEEVGMSQVKLNDYISWLCSKAEGEPFGTIIVRLGKIACEYYGSGANIDSKWDIGSIRKSVTSALLGMTIEEGKLSPGAIIYDVWPEIYTITGKSKDKKIKMRHLANMTSGWMTDKSAGEEWLYNNAACTAGNAVIGRVYNMPEDKIVPLVEERIRDKIQAASWDCYHYTDDFSPGNYGHPGPKLAIDSNMRDMARYGCLWLREGQWNGEQLIPRSYVIQAHRNQTGKLYKRKQIAFNQRSGRHFLSFRSRSKLPADRLPRYTKP